MVSDAYSRAWRGLKGTGITVELQNVPYETLRELTGGEPLSGLNPGFVISDEDYDLIDKEDVQRWYLMSWSKEDKKRFIGKEE